MSSKSPTDSLVQSVLDLKWHLDPVAATVAGIRDQDHRFGRFSPGVLAPHLAAAQSLVGALEADAVETLEEEIDRTAILNDVRTLLHRYKVEEPQARNPSMYIEHALIGLYQLMVRTDYAREEREAALRSRLEDLEPFLDDAEEALSSPSPLLAGTGRQILMAGGVLLDALERRAPLLADAVESARRAFDRFDERLDGWIEEGDRTWAIGKEAFNYRLRFEHGLQPTADELWRVGERLVEETEADLVAAARDLGSSDWRALLTELRDDHPAEADLVDSYRRAMERARDFVRDRGLLGVPDAPLEVLDTPPFLRPIIPFAAYDVPGPEATDRTGRFYVTAPDPTSSDQERAASLRDHCVHEIGCTAVHEGVPGHHLQFSRSRELPSLVRRHLWSPVTVEGWALYCEEMMEEEGFYQTPEERFLRRSLLLWRAHRIQLDVELHTRELSVDDATARLTDELRIDRGTALVEVRRYCAEPAYQLCYAVGRAELLGLRRWYREAFGASLNAFHEAVLGYGGLPVSLIRWGLASASP